MGDNWLIVLPLTLGLIGVYLLLPGPRRYPPWWGGGAAAAAVMLAGFLLIRAGAADPETILFYAFSLIAVVSGGLLITLRNPVHAALSFALVVLSTCGLFLLQAAPFLMAATMIVYAGAIVVTFLFVIMLAQQAGISDADQRPREPLLASLAGFVLLGTILYLLNLNFEPLAPLLRRTARAEERVNAAMQVGNRQLPAGDVQDVQQLLTDYKERAYLLKTSEELHDAVNKVSSALNGAEAANADLKALRDSLAELREAGKQAEQGYALLTPSAHRGVPLSDLSVTRDANGNPALPAENVGFLGRSLFTDYLLAVELGGTLLLVATVGAIVIAGRRAEGLR